MATRTPIHLFAALLLAAAFNVEGRAEVPQNGPIGPADTTVVALLHGNVITLRELDEYWRQSDPKSFQVLNEQLRKVRERALDGLIGERLLAREAERQHTTVERLTAGLSTSAVVETEVRDLYERSSAAAQGVTFDMARPAIETYLREQHARDARERYVNQLRRAATKELSVRLDTARQTIIVAADDPIRGASGARIDIVLFSDFECPYCAQVEPVLAELLKKFDGRVRLIWKDMPLPMHPSAVSAARAARCAAEQGRFWAYHDVLFANQQKLAHADLVGHARAIGLDAAAFSECLVSSRYIANVVSATERAAGYGVSATPTVFINGRPLTGVNPLAVYERAIEEELDRLAAGEPAK